MDYEELDDFIFYSAKKTFEPEERPCKGCDTPCFGMPDRCEKAKYLPGTRPHEIRQRVEDKIRKDINKKYLLAKEYREFEDFIFGIKWFKKEN